MRTPTAAQVEAWRRIGRNLQAREFDEALLADLIGKYCDPQRKYHSMQHLDECFAHFNLLRQHAEHPDEIELALWFHDAIYDVKAHDNETRSAVWAREAILAAGISESVAQRVHSLIMATRHQAQPIFQDERLIVDVDLAILGAPRSRFDEYELQIRQEYAWVADEPFRSGRCDILKRFLDRPRIYHSNEFFEAYESNARANLLRSITRLTE